MNNPLNRAAKKTQKPKPEPVAFRQRIVAALDLPKEIALNLPVVSITGAGELEIVNYKGIIEYTEERIRLSTTAGVLKIEGKKLILRYITSEAIYITGKLLKVEYIN